MALFSEARGLSWRSQMEWAEGGCMGRGTGWAFGQRSDSRAPFFASFLARAVAPLTPAATSVAGGPQPLHRRLGDALRVDSEPEPSHDPRLHSGAHRAVAVAGARAPPFFILFFSLSRGSSGAPRPKWLCPMAMGLRGAETTGLSPALSGLSGRPRGVPSRPRWPRWPPDASSSAAGSPTFPLSLPFLSHHLSCDWMNK